MDQQLQAQAVALRDLLSKSGKWTQVTLARDNFGISCHPCAEEADRFCLIGGVANVARVGCELAREDVYDAVATHPLGKAVIEAIGRRVPELHAREENGVDKMFAFNDSLRGFKTTHEDVKALLEDVVAEVSK